MADHVYKLLELAGSSTTGIEDAVQNAIAKASKTLRNIHWFPGGGNTRECRERQGGLLASHDQGRLHS
jgi:hypothetical protein